MVSLGSDDGESGSDAENRSNPNPKKEAKFLQRRQEERRMLPKGSRDLLGRVVRLTPAITPRTFFAGAAGRRQAKSQPAQ